jgi:AraC family transcriptional regulator
VPPERDILHLLSGIRNGLDADVSLEALAARSGWSISHFHRAFHRLVGETPKQYTLRLRLERAAVRLVTGRDPIVRIAGEVGFASHAVFTRAFRRHFGTTPASYRAGALAGAGAAVRTGHAAVTDQAGPCIGLFHLTLDNQRRRIDMPTLSIERRELTETPVLTTRLRPARHELAAAIGEGVGKVYIHAQTTGAALAGHPFTRYLSTGPGLFTIDVGIKLAAAAAGAGDVESGILPGGPAVVALHGGPYDQLGETYAAMERWMGANGLRPAGAPWEWYLTDPAEHPDTADWRTEVYWPVTA